MNIAPSHEVTEGFNRQVILSDMLIEKKYSFTSCPLASSLA